VEYARNGDYTHPITHRSFVISDRVESRSQNFLSFQTDWKSVTLCRIRDKSQTWTSCCISCSALFCLGREIISKRKNGQKMSDYVRRARRLYVVRFLRLLHFTSTYERVHTANISYHITGRFFMNIYFLGNLSYKPCIYGFRYIRDIRYMARFFLSKYLFFLEQNDLINCC